MNPIRKPDRLKLSRFSRSLDKFFARCWLLLYSEAQSEQDRNHLVKERLEAQPPYSRTPSNKTKLRSNVLVKINNSTRSRSASSNRRLSSKPLWNTSISKISPAPVKATSAIAKNWSGNRTEKQICRSG